MKSFSIFCYVLGLGVLVLSILGAMGYTAANPVAGLLVFLFLREVSEIAMAFSLNTGE